MKSNADLQHDVIEELTYEPSIDASNIGVVAMDGIVTLSGTVKSYADKYSAAHATERVAGVQAVADETSVDLPSLHKRDDQDIASAVIHALGWQVWVPKDAIKVKVEGGWVTLEGTVNHKFQKRAACDAVRYLTGVIGVNDLLDIKSAAHASDLKEKIEKAFLRAAELDAAKIGLTVTGNSVILSGNVSSWAERDEAERAAWSAPGVWAVENAIKIGV